MKIYFFFYFFLLIWYYNVDLEVVGMKKKTNLEISVDEIRRKIKYKKLYNLRNFLMRCILKTGSSIDKASPFLIALFIFAEICILNKNIPIKKDYIYNNAIVQTIDASNGIHLEQIVEKSNNCIEYSTKWQLNSDGLYEREITYYDCSNFITEDSLDIFSMSKEEISNLFVEKGTKKIIKSSLSKNDNMFNNNVIIITSSYISSDKVAKEESTLGNIIYSAAIILGTFVLGLGLDVAKKIFVRKTISESIEEYIPLYLKYTDESLNKLLKINLDNYNYLSNPSDNNRPKIRRLGEKYGK